MLKAAVYCRISRDPEGRELGVRRQEEDSRALASRLGATVVRVFVDNDVSASSASIKPRPQYDALLAAVDAGEIDVLVAYSNSRLTRRPAEWLGLIERANKGLQIATVASGQHDLTTADGRAVAMTVAVWDAAEAERTAERVRRAKQQAVVEGRWRGGRRPFGYEGDGVTPLAEEAVLVLQGTRDVLAGRSLAAVARDWQSAGVTGTSGAPFTATRVRRVLQRPRNAGLIEAGGEIVGEANWPAIVPEDEWRALQTVLSDPARRTSPGSERRWLGSGLYRCGVCGDGLRVDHSRNRLRVYACRARHVTRRQSAVDDYVRAVVAEYVRDPGIRDRLTERPDDSAAKADRDRAVALRRKVEQAERDYYDEVITGRVLKDVTRRAEAELQEISTREAGRMSSNALGATLNAPDPGAAFLAADLDRQRAVIEALVTVTINRGRRGRPPGWQPGTPYADLETVSITGREE